MRKFHGNRCVQEQLSLFTCILTIMKIVLPPIAITRVSFNIVCIIFLD